MQKSNPLDNTGLSVPAKDTLDKFIICLPGSKDTEQYIFAILQDHASLHIYFQAKDNGRNANSQRNIMILKQSSGLNNTE